MTLSKLCNSVKRMAVGSDTRNEAISEVSEAMAMSVVKRRPTAHAVLKPVGHMSYEFACSCRLTRSNRSRQFIHQL